MARLPSATIQRIARYLTLTERIMFSQTCQSIRSSLRLVADLWNRVDYQHRDVDRYAPVVGRHMARAAQGILALGRRGVAPIHLRVQMWHINIDDSESPHTALIIANLAHVSTFDLILSSYMVALRTIAAHVALKWKWMCYIVSCPAPNLRRLALRPFFMARFPGVVAAEAPQLPEHLLGGIPGLERLSLRGILLKADVVYPALAGLVTLKYYQLLRPLTSKEICTLLSNLPALEHLGLALGYQMNKLDQEQPSQLPAHRLKSVGLLLSNNSDAMLEQRRIMVLFIEVPALRVRLEKFSGLEGIYAIVPATMDLHVTCGGYETEISSSNHEAPKQRIIFHLSMSHILRLMESADAPPLVPASQVHRLVSLTVHESVFAIALLSLPAALPALLTLRVVLATRADHFRHYNRNDPALSGFAIFHPIKDREGHQFPSLQEVQFLSSPPSPTDTDWTTISPQACWFQQNLRNSQGEMMRTCRCTNPAVVALHDLHELLTRILAPGQRIHRLLIAGIHHYVDIDPAASLCALYQVADRLDFDELAPVDVVEACRQTDGATHSGIPTGPDLRLDGSPVYWEHYTLLPGFEFPRP